MDTISPKDKNPDKKEICLVTLTPPHYREEIFRLLDSRMNCKFILGDMNPSIKRIPKGTLKNAVDVKSVVIPKTPFYWLKSVLRNTKDADVIIDDMGIFCLTSWGLILLAKFRSQKIIIWSHGWYGREGFAKKWLKRLYSSITDGMFLYGNYAKTLMEKNGFDASKLHVIHNSLSYTIQKAIRGKLSKTNIYEDHFGNKSPVLIFIGRLTQVKRLDLLIQALVTLRDSGKYFNLVLVGDGSIKSELETLASQKKIANQIWFWGACYQEDKNAELLYNADLCVAPGNIGLTAMHAMMYGCPCMSHNNFPMQMPEFEAIRPNKSGDFFNYLDVTDMASKIANWFENPEYNREKIRKYCFDEIDSNWNPNNQIEIIAQTVNDIK